MFVTKKEYVSVWPAAETLLRSADFTRDSPGAGIEGTSTVEGGDSIGGPVGGTPVAVAVLLVVPRSTSAWVSV